MTKRDQVFELSDMGYTVREIAMELRSTEEYVRRALDTEFVEPKAVVAKPHGHKSAYKKHYLMMQLEAAKRRVKDITKQIESMP